MVELLLNSGCDVNEVMHSLTVCESYIHYSDKEHLDRDHHRKIVWLLITSGARQTRYRAFDGRLVGWANTILGWNRRAAIFRGPLDRNDTRRSDVLTMASNPEADLTKMFGPNEAQAMQQYISEHDPGRTSQAASGWLGAWRPTFGEAAGYIWKAQTRLLGPRRPSTPT